MKKIGWTLIGMCITYFSFGQRIYKTAPEDYSPGFFYKFYIFEDSTCYLKFQNADNSTYDLYKGKLKQLNDTLFEFSFQPVISITANRAVRPKESLGFDFKQVDTTIASFEYDVQRKKGEPYKITVKPGNSVLTIKRSEDEVITIDSKFVDPVTKKNIFVTVNKNLDPSFTYYGANTEFTATTISIINNKMTIYKNPKRKYINRIIFLKPSKN
ncbi:MAG TPA: hypothetical protein VFF27_13115 [Bacteroidia bacterium]|jgi:hypothetical protein|nr:hypothetical protein [Bacteroidia bacterium]